MRLLFALVVLGLLGGGGFLLLRSGGGIPAPDALVTEAPAPTPEVTVTIESKLDSLVAGRPVRFSGPELTTLLHSRGDLWAAGGASPPVIAIRNDTVHVTGSVATDRLPPDPTLDAVRIFLPDTTQVAISGTLRTADDSTLAFDIAALQVAGIAVPAAYVPEVLDRLGFERRPDIGPGAIAVPLPTEIASAAIADDTLLLTPLD